MARGYVPPRSIKFEINDIQDVILGLEEELIEVSQFFARNVRAEMKKQIIRRLIELHRQEIKKGYRLSKYPIMPYDRPPGTANSRMQNSIHWKPPVGEDRSDTMVITAGVDKSGSPIDYWEIYQSERDTERNYRQTFPDRHASPVKMKNARFTVYPGRNSLRKAMFRLFDDGPKLVARASEEAGRRDQRVKSGRFKMLRDGRLIYLGGSRPMRDWVKPD